MDDAEWTMPKTFPVVVTTITIQSTAMRDRGVGKKKNQQRVTKL